MKLRKPLLLGIIIGVGLSIGPVQASDAQISVPRDSMPVSFRTVAILWDGLEHEQKAMVDLVAADFYDNQLSVRQRLNIAATTSDSYRNAAPRERNSIRKERRAYWQSLSEQDRQILSATVAPSYDHLSEAQKAPFRQFAIEKLDIDISLPASVNLRDAI
jgi:hypothetical protein